MKFGLTVMLALGMLLASGCAPQPTRVYAPGFSFADYRYVVVEPGQQGGVYGLDIALAQNLSANGLQVLGHREVNNLPVGDQQQVLGAVLSVDGNDDRILLGVVFQNFSTGRSLATVGQAEEGDLFDGDDRQKAFRRLVKALNEALSELRDSGGAGAGVSMSRNRSAVSEQNPPPAVEATLPPPAAGIEDDELPPYVLEPVFD